MSDVCRIKFGSMLAKTRNYHETTSGPRLMICGAIRIICYAESDGNCPAAQNQTKTTENYQNMI